MAGVGLLLLRTAIGLVTAWQGVRLVASADSAWVASGAGLTAILAAAALIAGLLTPCAAALVAIGAALSASRAAGPIVPIMVTHDGLAHGLVLIDAVSLVLLGPARSLSMRGSSGAARFTFASPTVRRLSERLARLIGFDTRSTRLTTLLMTLAVAVTLAACGTPPPRITFTEIPPAALGGSIRTATIAGRVEGARPGDRIVLFAKSRCGTSSRCGSNPFTTIDAQGHWRSTIHLGTRIRRDGGARATIVRRTPRRCFRSLGAHVPARRDRQRPRRQLRGADRHRRRRCSSAATNGTCASARAIAAAPTSTARRTRASMRTARSA